MLVFADMQPVMDFVAGDHSEKTKELLFASLKKAFFNVASVHAPKLKNDPDFRMDIVTYTFGKLHKKDIDFYFQGGDEKRAMKAAYAFIYKIMWNGITQKKRKMKYLDFDVPDGDEITNRLSVGGFDEESVLREEDFKKELHKVFGRAAVLGLSGVSLKKALEDTCSVSGEMLRAVMVRTLFLQERKQIID